MNRAAIYLRVSTDEQTTENQLPEIRRLARARKLRIVAWYQETASAAGERHELAKLLEHARKGAFDLVLVWSLDRFGRSMFGNLRDVLELERVGVRVVSVRESWLDVDGPTRNLMIAIISWVAEQERARLIERTKAGMERARREGKQIGRERRLGFVELEKLRRLVALRKTQRQMAAAMRVPRSTLRGYLRRLQGEKGGAPRAPRGAARAALT